MTSMSAPKTTRTRWGSRLASVSSGSSAASPVLIRVLLRRARLLALRRGGVGRGRRGGAGCRVGRRRRGRSLWVSLGELVGSNRSGDPDRGRGQRPARAASLVAESMVERELAGSDLGQRERRGDQHGVVLVAPVGDPGTVLEMHA